MCDPPFFARTRTWTPYAITSHAMPDSLLPLILSGPLSPSKQSFHMADANHATEFGNCAIKNIPPDQLSTFYRGLAINISMQLSRARLEAIRISECRAFNDRQTVLRDQDETEQLRIACIKGFSLPMTEKVAMIIKGSIKSPDFR